MFIQYIIVERTRKKGLKEKGKRGGHLYKIIKIFKRMYIAVQVGLIAEGIIHECSKIIEALRVQMEVQRRLHDQLEVQCRLLLRIEAQGKYLQSILEKACKALNDLAVATAGLEAAREELSELAIKVANDCSPSDIPMPWHSEVSSNLENGFAPSIDSCLTSNGSPVSPSGLSSQAAVLRKRQRAMFSNGQASRMDDVWIS